jgi:hypothetical protein
MSYKLWQQGAAIFLVFLFLGPTNVALFHKHAADHIEHCTAQGEDHLHSFEDTPSCFICSFPFSTFEAERETEPAADDLLPMLIRPDLLQKKWRPLLIALDHAPRGPPFFPSANG